MNIESVRKSWVGKIVDGSFPLQVWLGGTESAEVFLTELHTNRPLKAAIKLIPADSPDAEERYAGWTASAELSHPHLLRVLKSGHCSIDERESIYAVTEFSDEILSAIVAERPLSPHEGRELLGPAIDALTYLHGKGFVHGRLKPSNVLVVNDQLKLSGDSLFSTSRAAKPLSSGNPFDAPEFTHGVIAPAADVWSLGVALIEAMTQSPPLWDRSTGRDPVPTVALLPPFAEIARECLRIDPAQRCSLAEIASLLKSGSPIPSRAGAPQEPKPSQKLKFAIFAGALLVVAAIAIFLVRSHIAKPSPVVAPASQPAQLQPAITQPAPTQPAQESSKQAQQPESPASTPPVSTPASSQPQPGDSAANPSPVTAAPEPPAPKPAAAAPSARGDVAERVMPQVPAKALATIQGKVSIDVLVSVNSSGAVDNATLRSGSSSKYFSNLALEAARSWKFVPPQAGGQPARSQWLLRFQFRQSGPEVTPSQQ